MVLIAGAVQISWPKLRSYLGLSRISLASKDEVFEQTGYKVGSVTPLGIQKNIRILADNNIFQHDEISIGSGLAGTAIILNSRDLLLVLDQIEIGDFAEN